MSYSRIGDNQTLVDAMRQHHPGRIVALNESVRVHSGLTEGGNGRVMGTARGPLLDLLLTAGALGVVGSAGSSFSEVASLLALGPPPLANLRVRTPFIKSYQGKVRSIVKSTSKLI